VASWTDSATYAPIGYAGSLRGPPRYRMCMSTIANSELRYAGSYCSGRSRRPRNHSLPVRRSPERSGAQSHLAVRMLVVGKSFCYIVQPPVAAHYSSVSCWSMYRKRTQKERTSSPPVCSRLAWRTPRIDPATMRCKDKCLLRNSRKYVMHGYQVE